MGSAQVCLVPVGTYRRLWLLYLLERFRDACFGKVRLQKVAYFSEERMGQRPFAFQKAPYGPYSEGLEETLEQLLSMGLVKAEPLGKDGNKYRVVRAGDGESPYGRWLESVDPPAKIAIDQAVAQYGYLPQERLIETGHSAAGFEEAAPFDEILSASSSETVEVSLDTDECDELVLSLSPAFDAVRRQLEETDWAAHVDRIAPIDRL